MEMTLIRSSLPSPQQKKINETNDTHIVLYFIKAYRNVYHALLINCPDFVNAHSQANILLIQYFFVDSFLFIFI